MASDEGYYSDSDVEFEEPIIIVDEYLCVEINYIKVIEEGIQLKCCRDCAPTVEGHRVMIRHHFCTNQFSETFIEENSCSECLVSLVQMYPARDCDRCFAFVNDFDLE